jgi:3,5-epimerase/4-reductase
MNTTNPEILLFGSNGWIGKQVCDLLKSRNIIFHKANARADNKKEVEREISCIPNVTHVMCFIGRTHGVYENNKIGTIDYLEKPGKLKENIRDNLFSPLVLAEICKNKNIHFTYLGTGCIFDYDEEHVLGDEKNGFTETDEPNFFGSSYSIVKGYTDRLMKLLYSDTALNLRIRMPITDSINERNFITKITNYDKICSIPNSMTVLPELLPIVLDMMKNNVVGTMNLTNPGLISHNEVLTMYRDIVDPTFTWENFSQEEQRKILSSDRSNNYLDTTRLESLYPAVSNIKDSVKNCLIEYKNIPLG